MSVKRFFIVLILFFAFLGITACAAGFWWVNQPNLNDTETVIDIPKGATLNGLAQQWQNDGWLRSALALKIAARLSPLGNDIRPGEFILPKELTNFELLRFLASAKAKTYRLTLIEGRPISEAVQILAEAEHLEQDLGELTLDKISEFLKLSGNLEAQLYPDTYVYHRNEPVSALIRQAHDRLNSVLAEEWTNRATSFSGKSLPYKDSYQALTMASIVEKETGVASERSVIAGVFVRRLHKNMRLETDPTVIYGLGESYEGNLKRSHLRDRSNEYNTYRHKGLPPGPIALAGREAIHAALHPASGTELYFVAKGDGSHYFSSTLAEHNSAVRRYQLKRRSDYRSSPAPSSTSSTEKTQTSEGTK